MNLTARGILLLHNVSPQIVFSYWVLKMQSKVSLGTCNTKYNNYTLDRLPVNFVFVALPILLDLSSLNYLLVQKVLIRNNSN